MAKTENAPVIIKRKKVIQGGGHHGGAWKVAYADFVTAMMAFFLLMWLLNATTETQRKGIADYFSPTIPVHRVSGGGDGVFGGDNIFSREVMFNNISGTTRVVETESPNGGRGDTGADFADIEKLFHGDSGESSVADDLLKHVNTRVTDKGLIIELFDLESSPLFDEGGAEPTEKMTLLLEMVAEVVAIVTNSISISGHTDTGQFEADAFIVSTDRAQYSRRMLMESGIPDSRITRVEGHADRTPAPYITDIFRNRRVEITLLRSTY